MNWDENIPDTKLWQPREDAKERLSKLFFKRCSEAEQRILARVKVERDCRIDNFDSGPGIEDIFREEFSQILPKRYAVKAGVLDGLPDNLLPLGEAPEARVWFKQD